MMTMTKRDWATLHNANGFRIVAKGSEVVAVVWADDGVDEKRRGDLIAAAPDLRDALAGLLALCEASLSPDSDAVRGPLDAARLALQKAEASRG